MDTDRNSGTGSAMRGWFAAILLVSALLPGCAATSAGTDRSGAPATGTRAERVMLARAGARVTIEWHTRVGTVYALVYKDRPDPQQPWRPVEGYARIQGTGRVETIFLPSWPGDARRFTVMSAPVRQAHRLPGGQRPD